MLIKYLGIIFDDFFSLISCDFKIALHGDRFSQVVHLLVPRTSPSNRLFTRSVTNRADNLRGGIWPKRSTSVNDAATGSSPR